MNRFRSLLVLSALAMLAGLGALVTLGTAKEGPATKGTVLALVNGQPVTEPEVIKIAGEQLKNLEREYKRNRQTLLESTLQTAVQDRMLEAEAKQRNMTQAQLLGTIKPKPVVDSDVDVFYEQNKSQIPQPKEQVAPQIKAYLEQQAQLNARSDFFRVLETRYKVEMKLEPLREQVGANGPATGPVNAPVTIVEFSEFQCPFCARFNPTLQQVRAKYGDKVRIVFRQFPLPFHPFAQKAAEASLCANDQGKFWELHDAMFANQQALGVDQLKAKAAELKLDSGKFNACLDSGKHVAAIESDKREGEAVGVTGTPGMFINGRFLNGAVPLEPIAAIIDDELRRKGIAIDGGTTATKK